MGAYEGPLAPLGAHGHLWGPMGAYPDGPMGACWGLRGPIGTFGDLWAPLGAYEGLWGPMGTFFFLPLSLLIHFPQFPILVFKVFFTFVLP